MLTSGNKIGIIAVLVLTAILAALLLVARASSSGLEAAKTEAYKKSKIFFPEIADTSGKVLEDLPKELPGLIPSDAKKLAAKTILYQNKQNGVMVSYQISDASVPDFFQISRKRVEISGWKYLEGFLTSHFAFFDAERKGVKIRASITEQPDGQLQIEIHTL